MAVEWTSKSVKICIYDKYLDQYIYIRLHNRCIHSWNVLYDHQE